MITVSQASERIIKRSRFLTEAMAKNLINASSLARYIQPEVEEMVFKKVSKGSLIMAIKRIQKEIHPHYKRITIFQEAPDMIVRSNLTLFHVANSEQILRKLLVIEEKSHTFQKKALFVYGRVETVILTNKISSEEIQKELRGEQILSQHENISAITIHLPAEAEYSSGIVYFFIKSLAWEGINLLEVLLTHTELTLVFQKNEVEQAFHILQSLFRE
jgi:hypothetical protein